MVLRFESHVHTNFSDGQYYKFMIRAALKKRIDILAITDHNNFTGYEFCKRYAKDCARRGKGEIFILPAEEVGCKEGDVLAYGISEEIKEEFVTETIDIIHDQGALAVMAHPFSIDSSISMRTAKRNKFDGIEILNYTNQDINRSFARRYALYKPQLFQLGGDDAHQPWDLGFIINAIDAEPETDSILDALKNHRIRIYERFSAFPWRARKTLLDAIRHGLTYLRCGLKYQIRWMKKRKLKNKPVRDYEL